MPILPYQRPAVSGHNMPAARTRQSAANAAGGEHVSGAGVSVTMIASPLVGGTDVRPFRLGFSAIAILAASAVFAQFMMGSRPARPKLEDKDDIEIEFKAEDASFDDVLKTLRETTGLLILADDQLKEQHKDAKFTISEKGKITEVLLRVCMRLSAIPQTAVIFCTEKEKPERQPVLDWPDKKITAKLPEMPTETVLGMVGAAAGLSLHATQAVVKDHQKLSVDLDEKPAEDAVKEVAEKLGAVAVRGIYLKKFDADAAFKQFMSLPADQQEKILLRAAKQTLKAGMSADQVDKAVDQALQRFFQMSKDERQKTVQRMSNRFHQLAGAVRRFSPETIRQLREAWRPIIRRAVSRIRRLPAHQQAELAPILRALDQLPFAR